MAELNRNEKMDKNPRAGSHKKLLSIKVDLTPLVDLGFLLITFFIFTTTISQPTTMKLFLPDDKGNAMPAKESGALTLIPVGNGKILYYEGKLGTSLIKSTDKLVRSILLEKKNATSKEDFFVIIKPTNTATYGDIVALLDEMTINDVNRYAIVDISNDEKALVN